MIFGKDKYFPTDKPTPGHNGFIYFGAKGALARVYGDLLADAGGFFWLDISGGDPSARHALITEAGLNAADAAWALRFGQAGRMHIGKEGLRPPHPPRAGSRTRQ